jgi:hypothetical protein
MFLEDLQHQRSEKWRIDGKNPVRTLDDAQAFIDAVGFCLIYPVRPAVALPTFIGAVLGTGENLPVASKAAIDPRTGEASELVLRLLDQRIAFEVPLGESGSLLVSTAEFPYFYALLGDRNPKSIPSEGVRGEKRLASQTFRLLAKQPMSEQEMIVAHGKGINESALARVLHELWSKLRIVRTNLLDRSQASPVWDVLYRVAPPLVNRGAHLSQAEALSAILGRYLETVIAAEQREIEDFFGHIATRSKAAEVVRALMAAREVESIKVGFHSMLRLVPRHLEREELPGDLGSVQKRSLGGERRYAPDPTKKMVMRDDRRNLQRRDRREPKSVERPGRKPVR